VPRPRQACNQFLIDDELPTLIHTGTYDHYEPVRAAISQVLDPARLAQIVLLHLGGRRERRHGSIHGRSPTVGSPTLDPADVRAAPEVALRPARGGTRAGAQPGLEPGLVLREARARRAPQSESAAAAAAMIRTMTIRNSSTWTAEERAREERARTIRARQDREKTPEERLEETLRLSKLISELQQGAARDVPGR
jgi:hypothetical protein